MCCHPGFVISRIQHTQCRLSVVLKGPRIWGRGKWAFGRIGGCVLIFSCENTKIATSCWTIINRRMPEPTKKNIPYVQRQRRSCNKMVGGVQLHLKSNLIPARDTQRAQTKPCVRHDPGKGSSDPHKRLSQTCLWVSPAEAQVSSGQPRGQGLWLQQTWEAHVLA